MTEFWIVRHTAVAVAAGTCYGRSDVPLRESFAEEAAAVLRRLQGERFDQVWSSPLGRCTRLAAFCGYADARRDDRLRELDFGAWEMQRFDAIRDPQLRRWYDDWIHERPTGGESFADQCRRVGEFLEEVARNLRGTAGCEGREGHGTAGDSENTGGRAGSEDHGCAVDREKRADGGGVGNPGKTAGCEEAKECETAENSGKNVGREEAGESPRRVLVFAHGGVQLAAGVYAGRFGAGEAFAHQLGYGEIFRIRI